MLGNVIILVISGLLLRIERKQLIQVLGLTKPMYRLLQFGIGFLATALLAILISSIFSIVANFEWVTAGEFTGSFFLDGLYRVFNSVLYEELIFRGYLLFKAIEYLGELKANFLSAAAFGVYHWFSFNILGNPILMGWVLFYTGVWGLMFAYSYSKTRSIALPVGLHLGWNLVDQYIFSDDQLSLFESLTSIHTRNLSSLESMLYIHLPVLAFAVMVVVLLSKFKKKYSFG